MKVKSLLLFVLISFVPVLQKAIYAQNAFPYGVFLNDNDSLTTAVYSAVSDLGMNYVCQYARAGSSAIKSSIGTLNLIAVKEDKPEDYIGHYARGYYSKWESEENQTDDRIVGVKHSGGDIAEYGSVICWKGEAVPSLKELNHPIIGLVTGPDYRQDKKYKLNYLLSTTLNYTVNFNLAYVHAYGESPDSIACRIGVRYKYKEIINGGEQDQIIADELIPAQTIKVSELNETFQKKTLNYNYSGYLTRAYIDTFLSRSITLPIAYDDEAWGTGIEFYVDFLGQGTLYVDYVEVYDQDIWGNNFMIPGNISTSITKIINFANSYSGWDSLKYFYAADEPQTIDQYEPIRFVDSILRDSTTLHKRIISAFNPQWDGGRNGELTVPRFKSQANPSKIMTDYYPFFIGTSNEYVSNKKMILLK